MNLSEMSNAMSLSLHVVNKWSVSPFATCFAVFLCLLFFFLMSEVALLYKLKSFKFDCICILFLKDIASGKSILFAPRLSADYAVWLGEIKPLSYFKVIILWLVPPFFSIQLCKVTYLVFGTLQERYMVDLVCHTDEIVDVLQIHNRGAGKPMLFLLHGLNTDSNKFCKPAELGVCSSNTLFFCIKFCYAFLARTVSG